MKNNIDGRKQLLTKLKKKAQEEEMDQNFADVLSADDFDSALDEYVGFLLNEAVRDAFSED